MSDKKPYQPSEIPVPETSPEIRPDNDPGTETPKLPDNPWPEKDPAPPSGPSEPTPTTPTPPRPGVI